MEKNKTVIGGILAVIVIGLGIWLLNGMNNNDDGAANTTQSQSTSQAQPSSQATSASSQTIVDLAAGTSSLSTLVTAVTKAELVDTLKSSGQFTVFAPTNEAFSKLPQGSLDNLLKEENKTQLQSLLTYHVVPSKAMSSQLSDGQVLTTVQGGKLTVRIMDGKVMLEDAKGNKANVVQADIQASNGIVHVIDSVVSPQ